MVPDDRVAVEGALFAAANADGLVRGDFEALEIMRVEAGIALSGAELRGLAVQVRVFGLGAQEPSVWLDEVLPSPPDDAALAKLLGPVD